MLDHYDDISCFTIKDIADTCGVDLTTARRWKRRAQSPPPWALPLMRGDLEFLDPAWKGWRLIRGNLVSPESWVFSRGDVLAQRLAAAQIAAYQVENRRLKNEIAEAKVQQLEEQPTVDQWDVQILTG
jgi:hypothetical protein